MRYLRGELSAEERDAFENRYFVDDELFEELIGAESDSYDDYARGELDASGKEVFERHLLATPGLSRRVKFARSLVRYLERGRSATPVSSTARRSVAYFALAALLIFVIGLLAALLSIDLRQRHELAELRREQSDLHRRTESSERQAPALSEEPRRTGALDSGHAPPTRVPHVRSFVLAAGLLRAGGEQKTIPLDEETTAIRLNAILEGDSYPSYSASLGSAEGRLVWRADGLTRLRLPSGEYVVTCQLPADVVQSGDYVLKLQGRRPDGTLEDLNAYVFRATRR
jgi:hypothetical protein